MAIIAPVTSSDATLESWNRPSSASTMPVDDPLSTRMTVVRAPAQTLLTSSPSMWMYLLLPRNPSNAATASSIVVAGSSSGTGRRSTSTRSVASVPAAGMRTVSSRSPSFSFHRILTTWLPSVLSVASMCRAVIFGSFSMRRVRFFPGHVPAVLTSVDAGRACGPIGASANQDGGRHGRRGSATSPKNVTDPRRNPDTRFAAEDDGGRGIGAVLAGHDGRRGLCESAMPWLASYV